MDRAYRRLVLLLGIMICLPAVVNTHAMSRKQYSELESVLTRAAICEIEATFNEPRQHKERFKQLCNCIGQFIHRKIVSHVQIMEYDRYHQDNFIDLSKQVTGHIKSLIPYGDQKLDKYGLDDMHQEQVVLLVYDTDNIIMHDMENDFVNSQMFTSYKVILSKMNNKNIPC